MVSVLNFCSNRCFLISFTKQITKILIFFLLRFEWPIFYIYFQFPWRSKFISDLNITVVFFFVFGNENKQNKTRKQKIKLQICCYFNFDCFLHDSSAALLIRLCCEFLSLFLFLFCFHKWFSTWLSFWMVMLMSFISITMFDCENDINFRFEFIQNIPVWQPTSNKFARLFISLQWRDEKKVISSQRKSIENKLLSFHVQVKMTTNGFIYKQFHFIE